MKIDHNQYEPYVYLLYISYEQKLYLRLIPTYPHSQLKTAMSEHQIIFLFDLYKYRPDYTRLRNV